MKVIVHRDKNELAGAARDLAEKIDWSRVYVFFGTSGP